MQDINILFTERIEKLKKIVASISDIDQLEDGFKEIHKKICDTLMVPIDFLVENNIEDPTIKMEQMPGHRFGLNEAVVKYHLPYKGSEDVAKYCIIPVYDRDNINLTRQHRFYILTIKTGYGNIILSSEKEKSISNIVLDIYERLQVKAAENQSSIINFNNSITQLVSEALNERKEEISKYMETARRINPFKK